MMKSLLKSVMIIVVVVYIGVDAAFFTIAKPVGDWVGRRRILDGLRSWIVSVRPYPTLVLFIVPIVVLEPLKPFAAYLIVTGHFKVAVTVFAVGEIVKLVVLERLLAISRDKLMLIPVFCSTYQKFCQTRKWLESTETWQAARRWSRPAHDAVRRHAMNLKASLKPFSAALSLR